MKCFGNQWFCFFYRKINGFLDNLDSGDRVIDRFFIIGVKLLMIFRGRIKCESMCWMNVIELPVECARTLEEACLLNQFEEIVRAIIMVSGECLRRKGREQKL